MQKAYFFFISKPESSLPENFLKGGKKPMRKGLKVFFTGFYIFKNMLILLVYDILDYLFAQKALKLVILQISIFCCNFPFGNESGGMLRQ